MSNAPFILTLDCDMYTNNSEALRQAMCFFLDPKTGHQFAFVQFPQGFNGITKNDLYANDHLRICYVSIICTFDMWDIMLYNHAFEPIREIFIRRSNLKGWMVLTVQYTQALDAFTAGMLYVGEKEGTRPPNRLKTIPLLKLKRVHRRCWKMQGILPSAPARRTPCGAKRQIQLAVLVLSLL